MQCSTIFAKYISRKKKGLDEKLSKGKPSVVGFDIELFKGSCSMFDLRTVCKNGQLKYGLEVRTAGTEPFAIFVCFNKIVRNNFNLVVTQLTFSSRANLTMVPFDYNGNQCKITAVSFIEKMDQIEIRI